MTDPSVTTPDYSYKTRNPCVFCFTRIRLSNIYIFFRVSLTKGEISLLAQFGYLLR